MTKRLNSKHKVDRRLKVNLWGRPKSPFNTRAYGPGQHGQTKTSKPSDYGIQLQAKQKLKAYYGNINEKQFRNIYKKAVMSWPSLIAIGLMNNLIFIKVKCLRRTVSAIFLVVSANFSINFKLIQYPKTKSPKMLL